MGGAFSGRSSGRIRVTADALRIQGIVPGAVGRFREAFRGIELRLRGAGPTEGLRLLDAGDSDLHCGGLDTGGVPDALRRQPLSVMTMGVVAHRCHPLRAGGATVEALVDWPWVDCAADIVSINGPEAGSPSLKELLDRLHGSSGRRRCGRSRPDGVRHASAWLPLELLAWPPWRPLSPAPGVREAALPDEPGSAPLFEEPGAGARPARPAPRDRRPGLRLSPSEGDGYLLKAWIFLRTAFSFSAVPG